MVPEALPGILRSRSLNILGVNCSPDLPTFDELCDAEDDKLFDKAIRQSNHYSCRNTPRTYQTATSFHACFSETHIRLIIQWDWCAFSRSFKF